MFLLQAALFFLLPALDVSFVMLAILSHARSATKVTRLRESQGSAVYSVPTEKEDACPRSHTYHAAT